MILKFIKNNWFTVGLALLVVLAIARNRFSASSAREEEQFRELSNRKEEKFTDDRTAQKEDKSQLGIVPGNAATGTPMPEVDAATAVAYLRRFGGVASSEHKKFGGMPPSVILALSYVNSFSGKREAAAQANNYFGLNCSPDWEGQGVTLDGRCLRRYNTPWESFRDFSIYLAARDWYGGLRQSAGTDWQAWVKGISDKNLSDVHNPENELTKVIQAYRLFELDGK